MQTDPIADLLTRIRNASSMRHEVVRIPHSRMKEEIVRVLADEGFITGYRVTQQLGTVRKDIEVTLKYGPDNESVIRGLKRVSRPGLRVYAGSRKIPRILNGQGTAILSTSRGVMSGEVSRREKLGGEVLCYVW